jgi:hypothetical protein
MSPAARSASASARLSTASSTPGQSFELVATSSNDCPTGRRSTILLTRAAARATIRRRISPADLASLNWRSESAAIMPRIYSFNRLSGPLARKAFTNLVTASCCDENFILYKQDKTARASACAAWPGVSQVRLSNLDRLSPAKKIKKAIRPSSSTEVYSVDESLPVARTFVLAHWFDSSAASRWRCFSAALKRAASGLFVAFFAIAT